MTGASIPQAESKDSNESKRGGKRPGAGRKPDLVKRMIGRLSPATARDVLAGVDVEKVIKEIFTKGSLTLKQRTLADLWDRAYGRPAQAVSVSGAVVHAHWTPGKYSHLTDEEFAELARLSAKAIAPPGSDASQNAPGNQKESKPAIEAEVVASEACQSVESPSNDTGKISAVDAGLEVVPDSKPQA